MSRRERLSLLECPLPPGFQLRLLIIGPLGSRPYRSAEWSDALVVIERGEVELERLDGSLWPFAAGSVLWLAGLPVRALHNPRSEAALLASVSRRPHAGTGPMSSPAAGGLTFEKTETVPPRRSQT
jgi:hypothetical protein